MDKIERIRELTAILDRAAYVYEQEDREIMSNHEYDALYDELRALEQETGFVMANSPTQRAGYEVLSELPKERHESPMLSLDKTKEVETLADFLGEHEGMLSWKMDGLTIVLTYRGGELVKAVTRGNGEIGEVITNNAKVFKNIPLRIAYTGELVLRGEAVIRYSDFEEINARIERDEDRYKNPRNLCSGTVRQLNNEITAQRSVYCFPFTLISMDGEAGFATRHDQMEYLARLGFTPVEYRMVTKETIADDVKWFASRIEKNDFPSDGLVLCYDDIAYGNSLGRTAKFPRDAIAFKWRDEIRQTTLLTIEWSPSRTGLLNPVAIFAPVELEGTTVQRASVHNVSIVEELALGIGDTIDVYKANMIIPQISENHTRSGNTAVTDGMQSAAGNAGTMLRSINGNVPDVCPVCGGRTEVRMLNEAKTLYCTNPDCTAKKVGMFEHMVQRDALNIEGLSEATLEKLIGLGIVHKPADLFRLAEHREVFTQMEGFGDKSFENLLAACDKARTVSMPKFLYSLGIPGIGLANAKLICREFGYDWEKVADASFEDLCAVSGLGEVLAGNFTRFMADAKNRAMIDDLLSEITFEAVEQTKQSAITGKTFVITGSVMHFPNRDAVKDYIESFGGKVAGSVSAKTDYLINNDTQSNSTKNKKAKELGIPIISEEDFLALAGE
ncbi:MAG: NAD-dependent DNA ligase LigA [Lachnospiraceae bacterium]|nr:NAD-dependent DNA ligase LigA [Lachnospiraceae bacterium]